MFLPVQCFQVVCPSVHVRYHGWSILRSAYYFQCLLLQPLIFSNLFYVKIKFCWKCVKYRCRGWALYLWWQSARFCQHTDSDVHIQSIQSNTDHSSRYVHTIAGTAVIETHWINCTGECSQWTSVSCIYRAAFARTCSDVLHRVQACLDMPKQAYACPSMPTIVSLCNPDMPGHDVPRHVRTGLWQCNRHKCRDMSGRWIYATLFASGSSGVGVGYRTCLTRQEHFVDICKS